MTCGRRRRPTSGMRAVRIRGHDGMGRMEWVVYDSKNSFQQQQQQKCTLMLVSDPILPDIHTHTKQ